MVQMTGALLLVTGVVWCGVVWCGVVWCGVVWCLFTKRYIFVSPNSTCEVVILMSEALLFCC